MRCRPVTKRFEIGNGTTTASRLPCRWLIAFVWVYSKLLEFKCSVFSPVSAACIEIKCPLDLWTTDNDVKICFSDYFCFGC